MLPSLLLVATPDDSDAPAVARQGVDIVVPLVMQHLGSHSKVGGTRVNSLPITSLAIRYYCINVATDLEELPSRRLATPTVNGGHNVGVGAYVVELVTQVDCVIACVLPSVTYMAVSMYQTPIESTGRETA